MKCSTIGILATSISCASPFCLTEIRKASISIYFNLWFFKVDEICKIYVLLFTVFLKETSFAQ